MKQATRKFGRLWWVTVTVAVLLALLFAAETPLSAYAASENDGKGKYIKEMIMITAKDINDAKKKVADLNESEKKVTDRTPKTYYLFTKPIYSHGDTVDAKENITETYIAYTTTNNVKNSVKSIKSMYMKGGWSYEEYNQYLKKMEEKTDFLAKDLYKAICEYATHLKAGKTNALYAKKILDYLFEDDNEKYVSDFFVYLAEQGSYDAKNYEVVKPKMITFMMQANKDILATIECALMIACKDSYMSEDNFVDDTSFLTGMQSLKFLSSINGYKNNSTYAYLDVYVQDLLFSLPDVQKDIRFYINSRHMFSDAADEMAIAIQEVAYDGETENPDQVEGELIEEMKSGGSEEEQKAAKELESADAYLKSLSMEDQQSYNNGKMYYDALNGCEYTGYNNQYSSLLGLFMVHEGTTEEISKQYKNEDFYPFLNQLSDGQLALLKVGLPQFLSITVMPAETMDAVFDNMLDAFNEASETEEEKIKKGQPISVYKDVDRSLYIEDNGVALTSKAIVAAQSKPLAHVVSDSEKASIIAEVISYAAGGVAITGLLTTLGMARHVQIVANRGLSSATKNVLYIGIKRDIYRRMGSYGYSRFTLLGQQAEAFTITTPVDNVPVYANVKLANGYRISAQSGTKSFRASLSQCCANFLKTGFGIALEWINGISIAIFVIAILIEYLYPLIKGEKDEPYIDIPRVMCSYEEVFGQTKIENMNPVEDYIYYYGLKNPFLSEEDDDRANTRDGTLHKDVKDGDVQIDRKDTNILKYKIGDVANWTLKGLSRQWVAIYASTDSKAGKPILAESLTVLNSADGFSQDKELIPVIKFHENSAFDFNAAYAATKNKDLTPVYLGYKFDNNAGTTQTASVFSGISLWGGAVAGLILGGGIGTLVTYGIIRKRKKKTVVPCNV